MTRHSKAPSRAGSSARADAPLQVMIPIAVKRQLAFLSAEKGESYRTLMLRGLRAIGLDIPDDELVDRRKRRRHTGGGTNGTE